MATTLKAIPQIYIGYFWSRMTRDLQFSRIFFVDLVADSAFVSAAMFYVLSYDVPWNQRWDDFAVIALAVLLQIGKIIAVIDLEKRGGDARQFYGSDALVTTGLYGISRNPTYLLTMMQSGLLALLLILLASNPPFMHFGLFFGPLVFIGHYLAIDRLIIPNEEAALRQAHPKAFADYSSQVCRWFGRH